MSEPQPGQLHGSGYTCPNCRSRLDGYTALGADNPAPNPGDLTVCAYCSAALEFVENGLAPLTRAKLDALPADARNALLSAAHAASRARKLRGEEPKPVSPEFHAMLFERRKP